MVEDIEISTVKLCYQERSVPADQGDLHDSVLMVKFSRSEVANILEVGEAIDK